MCKMKVRIVVYSQKKLCMKILSAYLHTVILNIKSAWFMELPDFIVGNETVGDSQERKSLGTKNSLSNQNGTEDLAQCHISPEISNTPQKILRLIPLGLSLITYEA